MSSTGVAELTKDKAKHRHSLPANIGISLSRKNISDHVESHDNCVKQSSVPPSNSESPASTTAMCMPSSRQLRSNIQQRRTFSPAVPLTLPLPKHAQMSDSVSTRDIASVTETALPGHPADQGLVSKHHTRFVSSSLPPKLFFKSCDVKSVKNVSNGRSVGCLKMRRCEKQLSISTIHRKVVNRDHLSAPSSADETSYISPPSNKLIIENGCVIESYRAKHKRKPTQSFEEKVMTNTSKKKCLSRSRFEPRQYQIQSRELKVRLVETCIAQTDHKVDIVASVSSEGKRLSRSKSDRSKTDHVLTDGGLSAAESVIDRTIKAVDTVKINTDDARNIDLSLKSCHSKASDSMQERMDEGNTVGTRKIVDLPVEDVKVIKCQSMVRDVEEDPLFLQNKHPGLVGLVSSQLTLSTSSRARERRKNALYSQSLLTTGNDLKVAVKCLVPCHNNHQAVRSSAGSITHRAYSRKKWQAETSKTALQVVTMYSGSGQSYQLWGRTGGRQGLPRFHRSRLDLSNVFTKGWEEYLDVFDDFFLWSGRHRRSSKVLAKTAANESEIGLTDECDSNANVMLESTVKVNMRNVCEVTSNSIESVSETDGVHNSNEFYERDSVLVANFAPTTDEPNKRIVIDSSALHEKLGEHNVRPASSMRSCKSIQLKHSAKESNEHDGSVSNKDSKMQLRGKSNRYWHLFSKNSCTKKSGLNAQSRIKERVQVVDIGMKKRQDELSACRPCVVVLVDVLKCFRLLENLSRSDHSNQSHDSLPCQMPVDESVIDGPIPIAENSSSAILKQPGTESILSLNVSNSRASMPASATTDDTVLIGAQVDPVCASVSPFVPGLQGEPTSASVHDVQDDPISASTVSIVPGIQRGPISFPAARIQCSIQGNLECVSFSNSVPYSHDYPVSPSASDMPGDSTAILADNLILSDLRNAVECTNESHMKPSEVEAGIVKCRTPVTQVQLYPTASFVPSDIETESSKFYNTEIGFVAVKGAELLGDAGKDMQSEVDDVACTTEEVVDNLHSISAVFQSMLSDVLSHKTVEHSTCELGGMLTDHSSDENKVISRSTSAEENRQPSTARQVKEATSAESQIFSHADNENIKPSKASGIASPLPDSITLSNISDELVVDPHFVGQETLSISSASLLSSLESSILLDNTAARSNSKPSNLAEAFDMYSSHANLPDAVKSQSSSDVGAEAVNVSNSHCCDCFESHSVELNLSKDVALVQVESSTCYVNVSAESQTLEMSNSSDIVYMPSDDVDLSRTSENVTVVEVSNSPNDIVPWHLCEESLDFPDDDHHRPNVEELFNSFHGTRFARHSVKPSYSDDVAIQPASDVSSTPPHTKSSIAGFSSLPNNAMLHRDYVNGSSWLETNAVTLNVVAVPSSPIDSFLQPHAEKPVNECNDVARNSHAIEEPLNPRDNSGLETRAVEPSYPDDFSHMKPIIALDDAELLQSAHQPAHVGLSKPFAATDIFESPFVGMSNLPDDAALTSLKTQSVLSCYVDDNNLLKLNSEALSSSLDDTSLHLDDRNQLNPPDGAVTDSQSAELSNSCYNSVVPLQSAGDSKIDEDSKCNRVSPLYFGNYIQDHTDQAWVEKVDQPTKIEKHEPSIMPVESGEGRSNVLCDPILHIKSEDPAAFQKVRDTELSLSTKVEKADVDDKKEIEAGHEAKDKVEVQNDLLSCKHVDTPTPTKQLRSYNKKFNHVKSSFQGADVCIEPQHGNIGLKADILNGQKTRCTSMTHDNCSAKRCESAFENRLLSNQPTFCGCHIQLPNDTQGKVKCQLSRDDSLEISKFGRLISLTSENKDVLGSQTVAVTAEYHGVDTVPRMLPSFGSVEVGVKFDPENSVNNSSPNGAISGVITSVSPKLPEIDQTTKSIVRENYYGSHYASNDIQNAVCSSKIDLNCTSESLDAGFSEQNTLPDGNLHSNKHIALYKSTDSTESSEQWVLNDDFRWRPKDSNVQEHQLSDAEPVIYPPCLKKIVAYSCHICRRSFTVHELAKEHMVRAHAIIVQNSFTTENVVLASEIDSQSVTPGQGDKQSSIIPNKSEIDGNLASKLWNLRNPLKWKHFALPHPVTEDSCKFDHLKQKTVSAQTSLPSTMSAAVSSFRPSAGFSSGSGSRSTMGKELAKSRSCNSPDDDVIFCRIEKPTRPLPTTVSHVPCRPTPTESIGRGTWRGRDEQQRLRESCGESQHRTRSQAVIRSQLSDYLRTRSDHLLRNTVEETSSLLSPVGSLEHGAGSWQREGAHHISTPQKTVEKSISTSSSRGNTQQWSPSELIARNIQRGSFGDSTQTSVIQYPVASVEFMAELLDSTASKVTNMGHTWPVARSSSNVCRISPTKPPITSRKTMLQNHPMPAISHEYDGGVLTEAILRPIMSAPIDNFDLRDDFSRSAHAPHRSTMTSSQSTRAVCAARVSPIVSGQVFSHNPRPIPGLTPISALNTASVRPISIHSSSSSESAVVDLSVHNLPPPPAAHCRNVHRGHRPSSAQYEHNFKGSSSYEFDAAFSSLGRNARTVHPCPPPAHNKSRVTMARMDPGRCVVLPMDLNSDRPVRQVLTHQRVGIPAHNDYAVRCSSSQPVLGLFPHQPAYSKSRMGTVPPPAHNAGHNSNFSTDLTNCKGVVPRPAHGSCDSRR